MKKEALKGWRGSPEGNLGRRIAEIDLELMKESVKRYSGVTPGKGWRPHFKELKKERAQLETLLAERRAGLAKV